MPHQMSSDSALESHIPGELPVSEQIPANTNTMSSSKFATVIDKISADPTILSNAIYARIRDEVRKKVNDLYHVTFETEHGVTLEKIVKEPIEAAFSRIIDHHEDKQDVLSKYILILHEAMAKKNREWQLKVDKLEKENEELKEECEEWDQFVQNNTRALEEMSKDCYQSSLILESIMPQLNPASK